MTDIVTRLKPHCLNFWELLAINIALISPTMTAALIVPLMFGTSGNAGWLAYAFGTIMLMFVAFNLNQFAKRTTETGSMFRYAVMGLGRTPGSLAGWCLIWSYTFIGTAGMTGFATFAQQLLAMVGFKDFPTIPLFAICGVVAWVLAYKDIAVSVILMLVLEAASVALILILLFVTVTGHGFAADTGQLTLSGMSLSTIGLGVVVAVFSLVGFEAATQFGHEAKNPLKTIPRSVYVSLILTGLFFVIATYTETMALGNGKPTLDKLTAPLSSLADLMRVGYLKAPIAFGAMMSFFSLAASCMNSGARVIYAMSEHGTLHDVFKSAHPTNRTPDVALTIMLGLEFIIPTCMILGGLAVTDAFNDAGTFGAFGFCSAYFFISVAAPMYLKKIGQLKAVDVVMSVAAVLLLLVPAVGTVYPVPSPPVNMFPYIFAAYFLVGLIGFVLARKKSDAETPATTMSSEMVSEVA